MIDFKTKICPHCGSKFLVKARQGGYAASYVKGSTMGKPVVHLVCQSCGMVLCSKVEGLHTPDEGKK